MQNKLKDIFSNKMYTMGGSIHFQNIESYKKYLEALQIVQDEGRAIEVTGISSIDTEVRDGEMKYPFSEQKNLTKFIISPSTENVSFLLDTEYGKREVIFSRYYTTHEIILETDKNEIVYFKIIYTKNSSNITFSYIMQPCFANTIKDIVESYNTTVALLDKMFKHDESLNFSNDNIYNMRESFLNYELMFKRLFLVEQELKLSFKPAQINDAESDDGKLEELYFMLIEKKVIRLNAKLNNIQSKIAVESSTNKLEVGSELYITFLEDLEYTIFGQKITIYTANLVSNAIVKEIKEDVDGTKKVFYRDSDSEPMYISFAGFKTFDEAEQEMKTIMEHKERYTDALTVNEYMKSID